MWLQDYIISNKIQLTHNVFEITFTPPHPISITPGQFFTFFLPGIKSPRSFSVLTKKGEDFVSIIKRLEDGRGGSKEICDYEIGSLVKWIGPVGLFVDSKKENKKLFLWTWTGMVPLYAMIEDHIKREKSQLFSLILWNRTFADSYYLEEFENFTKLNSHFHFELYLSRENKEGFKNWYIKEFLTQENIAKYDEFYICGNPVMVDEVVQILSQFWIWSENIFKEKY